MSIDLKEFSLAGAGLEPFGDDAAPGPVTGPAKFCVNTRGKVERRQLEDRRKELRFQENRRVSKDRRPLNSWDKTKNL